MSIRRVATAASIAALAVAAVTGCTSKPASQPTARPAATTSATHRAPNADELAQLALAERQSTSLECQLEWDGPSYPGYEAVCSPRSK